MKSKEENYRDLRLYLNQKYGSAYMSAMAKMSVENPYDEHGLLKDAYALTQQEKDALHFFVSEQDVSKQPTGKAR